jgi:lipopolysaccharide export system protein LptA
MRLARSLGLVAILLAAAPLAAEEGGSAMDRLGLELSSGAPLRIRADELEALPDASGRDRVIFQQNVRVAQGDMVLYCNWLEAIYPKRPDGSDAPVGGQPDNQACSAQCTAADGRATLRRGSDVIEADQIVFDLCKGVLKARGNVVIQTQGQGEEPKP